MRSVLLYATALMVLFSACSKNELKRTPEEANIAREAMDAVLAIRSAYMEGNPEGIKTLSVSEDVLKYFSFSQRPSSLEFLFRWVELYDSKAEVYVSWKAIKKIEDAVSEREQRGLCLFVLEGKPFKLKKIMRENPFKSGE